MTPPQLDLAEYALALRPGTLIREQYEIVSILGRPGGFGITYLARDVRLECEVAVKEFIPRELAGRGTDRTTVVPHAAQEGELFRYGLKEFMKEAQRLAQVDHANVVRVRNFFEAHGTAYLVMDYFPGRTLASYLEKVGGQMPAATAVEVMMHLLDGLARVHAQGFLHRDLKPENIYLTREGRPILLDFGAARQAVGQRSQSLTSILTPGYAPIEQYSTDGSKQGYWTDVYGAAAVLYRMVTGVNPPEAFERTEQDALVEPRALAGDLPPHVNAALLRGLAVDRRQRPQSVGEFQDLLEGKRVEPPSWEQRVEVHRIAPPPPAPDRGAVAGVIGGVLFLLVILFYLLSLFALEGELTGAAAGDGGLAALPADTALALPVGDTTAAAPPGVGGDALASSHNERGNQLFEEGRYAEAAAEYREAVRLAPDDPVLWANLAGALNGQGMYGDAEASAREAVRLAPQDAYGHFMLGISLHRQEKHEQALAAFGEALARRPDSADYRAHYANQLHVLNRNAEALEEARRAVQAEPGNGFARNTLGNALYALGRYAEAVVEFEQALQLDPYNEVYRQNLENARQAAG